MPGCRPAAGGNVGVGGRVAMFGEQPCDPVRFVFVFVFVLSASDGSDRQTMSRR